MFVLLDLLKIKQYCRNEDEIRQGDNAKHCMTVDMKMVTSLNFEISVAASIECELLITSNSCFLSRPRFCVWLNALKGTWRHSSFLELSALILGMAVDDPATPGETKQWCSETDHQPNPNNSAN
jgi:hypothetical protein